MPRLNVCHEKLRNVDCSTQLGGRPTQVGRLMLLVYRLWSLPSRVNWAYAISGELGLIFSIPLWKNII